MRYYKIILEFWGKPITISNISLSLCPRWRNKMHLFIYLFIRESSEMSSSCSCETSTGLSCETSISILYKLRYNFISKRLKAWFNYRCNVNITIVLPIICTWDVGKRRKISSLWKIELVLLVIYSKYLI